MRFATYGEALIRYAPLRDREEWQGKPSAAAPVLRSVGGDELNVSVALGRLGWQNPIWASVLPSGPLGNMVRATAKDAGVALEHCRIEEHGEIGTFTVLPETGTCDFQRKNSTFAQQSEGVVQWDRILAPGRTWLHLTGISAMCCPVAAKCWAAGFHAAVMAGSPISVDLNHRPQQGTLEELWAIVSPQVPHINFFILSVASVHGLSALLGVASDSGCDSAPDAKRPRIAGIAAKAGDGTTVAVLPVLQRVHAKLAGPAVACCLKERDDAGVQKRWSLIIDSEGVHSTEATPTYHTPKDECGGGSAWAAGAIDFLSQDASSSGCFARPSGLVKLGPSPLSAARRADLLAALCQEVVGDHSTVSRSILLDAECKFKDLPAYIAGVPQDSNGSCISLSEADASARVQRALAILDTAKVIAILRAKNEAKAIDRAKELADLGFKAVEVTADSAGFAEGTLLPAVVKAVGERILVGVGTVTTVKQLEIAYRGGAHFALSPVRPTHGWGEMGFVRTCHAKGILAMPAAYTPQEIYECVEEHGAFTVKIFPAQLWSPSTLKDLKRIGRYGEYRLCPSGGIDAANVDAWLDAGATCCGMGSCLVGKDIAVDPNDTKALKAAEEEWLKKGRPSAAAMAKKLFS